MFSFIDIESCPFCKKGLYRNYEYFKKCCFVEGKAVYRYFQGGSTQEFLLDNWQITYFNGASNIARLIIRAAPWYVYSSPGPIMYENDAMRNFFDFSDLDKADRQVRMLLAFS